MVDDDGMDRCWDRHINYEINDKYRRPLPRRVIKMDDADKIKHNNDDRVIYAGMLVLFVIVSMYFEYMHGIPFKTTVYNCFTGMGIGTIAGKLIFG